MADTGTATVTEKEYGKGIHRTTVEWTTTAGGAFEKTFTMNRLPVRITQIATIPGSGGVQPDDNYDVVVNDADGIGVAQAQGINRDETDAEGTTYVAPTSIVGPLTMTITNAGASNSGTVRLLYREYPY